MMRQASVAVMEGRAAGQSLAQAQQLALAAVSEGEHDLMGGGLALPPPGRFERGVGVARTRSGSRADEGGLRDRLKVSDVR
jgi:hypothetical protein